MPVPAPDFKYAPHCTLASLAHVYPVDENMWEAAASEGGGVIRLHTSEFRRRCLSVVASETGEGIYSVVADQQLGTARRYVLNAAEKTVSIEGFEEPIDLAEFRKIAVRVTSDGKLISSMASPLMDQWHKCNESTGADDHLMDIREMAAAYTDSTDKFELYDHHSYDLETSGITDGLDFAGVMAKITAEGNPGGPTHVRFPLDEAFEGWTEIRNIPAYMRAPIRVAFDAFMRDMLGDFPDDRVTMVCAMKGDENSQLSEKLEEAGFDLEGMLPPFEGSNLIPGYKTGDVAFHRARGVDVIVFSDFMGTYAYAWPTEEGGKYEMPKADLMRRLGM